MDRQQQQQHIELACPSRGSLNDGARLVQMCPSLYLAACRGRPEEVMSLLLQQHGAGRAGRYQATGTNCVNLRHLQALFFCFRNISALVFMHDYLISYIFL